MASQDGSRGAIPSLLERSDNPRAVSCQSELSDLVQDDAVKQAAIEQRRQEMALSALHAIEAKERDLEFKKDVAKEMKVEKELMAQKLKEEKEQTRLAHRQIADDVRQMEQFAALAMEREAQKRKDQVTVKHRWSGLLMVGDAGA